MSQPTLPDRFDSVEAVEDFMTAPSDALVADLAKTPGDIIVLGVGGKMGPTLVRLAKRAAPSRRVMGVARFSEPGVREALVRGASSRSPPTCWIAPRSRSCPRRPTSCSWPAVSSAPPATCRSLGR